MNRDRGLPLSRFFLPKRWFTPVNESHAIITRPGEQCVKGAFVAGLLLYYGIKMKYTIRVSMDAVCPPRSGGAGLRLLKAFGEL